MLTAGRYLTRRAVADPEQRMICCGRSATSTTLTPLPRDRTAWIHAREGLLSVYACSTGVVPHSSQGGFAIEYDR
jgi:hypothetical protein